MTETLPQPSGEFAWAQASWGPALRCTAIAAPHLFSTHALQLRGHADAWTQLASAIGVDAERLLRPKQVHGDAVVVVRSDADSAQTCATAADIIMTRDASVA